MKYLDELLNKFLKWFDKNKIFVFITVLVTTFIVHFHLLSDILVGPDTLLNSLWHWAGPETNLGRFGLYFVQIIKCNIVSPVLSVFLSSILLSFSLIFIFEIFKIKNNLLRCIFSILAVVAPNFSVTLTFYYCSDAYLLALLFSVLAIYIPNRFNNILSYFIGALCIALSMGIYQSYFSVTLVLGIFCLIINVLSNVDYKQVLKQTGKYLLMGIVGLGLYYVILHIFLYLRHMDLSSYSGANTIGLSTLLELPKLIPQAYLSFFEYFFGDGMVRNTAFLNNYLFAGIFLVSFVLIIYHIINKKMYKNVVSVVLLIIYVVLLPVCFGVIEIMVPDVSIHLLTASSMIYFFILVFYLLELKTVNKIINALHIIVLICTVGVAWNYSYQNNASYSVMKLNQDHLYSTMVRVVDRIEKLNINNNSVLFVGVPTSSSTSLEAKSIYDLSYNFVTMDSLIWKGNTGSWKKYIYEYFGLDYNVISEANSTSILNSTEYKKMDAFPSDDSVKIINDVIVVKFN